MKITLTLIFLATVFITGCNQPDKSKNEESTAEKTRDSAMNDISTEELENALKRSQPAEDISDKEFDLFADIYIAIQEVSDSSQFEMVEIVQGEGMEIGRFNEIAQGDQEGTEINLTDIEKSQLGKIGEKFQAVQQKQQNKAMKILEDSEMGIERYQAVLMAIQQDEKLQTKLMAIFDTKIETH